MRLTVHDQFAQPIASAFQFAHDVHELGRRIPDGGTGALWFRGHADSTWELKPSAGRSFELGGLLTDRMSSRDLLQQESVLLQRFRRDAYPFIQRALTDWESITFAQHHQLPTRLLDWTSNPLVALFFAAETHPTVDGAIFAYRPRNLWDHHISTFPGENPLNPEVPEPLTVRGIKIVFPMLLLDRLVTQSGGFTIQDPSMCLMSRGSEEFDEMSLDILELHKWVLPASVKDGILRELHRVSVNRRTLFPGLDSLGSGLRIAEKFRQVPGNRSRRHL